MTYNLTFMNTSNNLLEITEGVNTAASGSLSAFLLFTMALMLFVVFKKYDTKVAFITSMAITSLMGILLWGVGLVTWYILIVPIALLFVGLMAKMMMD